MIKNILTYRLSFLHKALLFIGLFLALGTTTTFAQFAVSEDFRGAGNPDIIIGDDAILTSGNPDPVNGGWLRLTPATTYKKGYAYVNKTFPSSLGVLVDFEFKMWRPTTADGADGIGVFLFDGTVNPFALGGYGGSLGYAPNGGAGLKGGYVGIGLDAYGNFSNASEGRVGGPGVRPNAVVLRGPTTTNAATTNPFLAGTTIGINAGNFTYGNVTTTTNNNRAQDILDYNTNTTVRPADATYYRRIQIEIERLTTGGQYKISVRWKTNPTATTFTDITSYTTTDVPPGLLKLGFAASTGGDINYHEIRNLLVTTPNNMRVKKTANKDFIRTLPGSGTENQIVYTIEVTNDTPDPVFNINFLDELTDLSGALIPYYSTFPAQNGFEITSITSTGFTSGTLSQGLLANRITGNMGMAANSTATVTVTGTLRNYLPAGGFLVNTVTAKPPLDDDLNNNTSRVDTPVLVEGIDFATTHSVNQNCANGSNTFTINVANIGVVAADIGGSSGKKLRMAITVPSTTGFAYSVGTINGWTQIGGGVVSGNNTIYTYESNQTATVSSGGAYNYPIIYTVTKSGASAAYSTTSAATYFTTSNNSNAETGTMSNNNGSVNVVAKPTAPTTSTSNYYYCQGETATVLTANVTAFSGNTLKWYFDLNGGFSSDYAPTPQTNLGGKQSFWVTQTNGTCESDRTQIDVYVTPTPIEGSIAGDQYYCITTKPTTLTSVVDGSVGTPTGFTPTRTYRWESSPNGTNNWTALTVGTPTAKDYAFPATGTGSTVATTTYYRRITISTNGSKVCESPGSNTVAVVISSPTPGTIGSAQTICYNTAPAQLTSTAAPTGAGTMSFKWEYSTSTGGPWTDAGVTTEAYTPDALLVNTYFRRTTITTNAAGTVTCTSTPSGTVLITVLGQTNPGTIVSDQAICSGARPSDLTGPAATIPSGATLNGYRWEYATASTGPWAVIPNGTTTGATYSFPTTGSGSSVTANTYYRRVARVTQSGKLCDTPSNSILITVQTPQPGTIGDSQTICKGTAPLLLNSVAGGSGTGPGTVTYQWYSSTTSSTAGFNPIATNGTSESYQPGNLTVTTYYYRITKSATNGTNCQSVPSSPITITPVDAPQPGNLGNDNQTICSGGTPTAITSANDGSMQGTGTLTYQWETTTTPSVAASWTLISTATSKTYTPPAGLTQTTYYRRFTVANYPTSTCRSLSAANQAVVNINTTVVDPGQIGTSQIVCSGNQPPTINTTTGSTNAYNYIWQYSTDGTNWTTNTAQVSSSYYFSAPITVTTYYRRFGVRDCPGTTASNTVTMTVPPIPSAGVIGSNQTVCYGLQPALLTSQTAGAGTGYQWQESNNGGSAPSDWNNISGATSDTFLPPITYNKYYRRLTLYSGTCTVASNIVSVLVGDNINAGSISKDQTVCNTQTPDVLNYSNGGAGWAGSTGVYRWDYSTDGTNWFNTSTTTEFYTFSGPLSVTTYFRRATIGNTCTGEKYTTPITITVASPNGGVVDKNQTICYNSTPAPLTSISPGTGTGGFTYKWEYTTNLSGTWNTAPGTFNAADYSPVALTQTTYYRRVTTPATGSCVAYSNTITITVLSQTTAGSLTANQTICMDTAPGTIGSNTAPLGSGTLTYRWESSPNGSTGWTIIAGATSETYTPAVIHATTYYRRTTISTTGSGINQVVCESGTTLPITVATKNCKVISNPMIYQKVKN